MNASPEICHEPLISTTELSKELGFQVSVAFLEMVGASPMTRTSQGTYWRRSDIPMIKRAIAKYLVETT